MPSLARGDPIRSGVIMIGFGMVMLAMTVVGSRRGVFGWRGKTIRRDDDPRRFREGVVVGLLFSLLLLGLGAALAWVGRAAWS